ncbi:MAG: hypothetical protein JXP34_20145 [Planctomycetes bacterium]|nr:hypothetical protein [Planctomycetota bacterium]
MTLDPMWMGLIEETFLRSPLRVPAGLAPEEIILARGARATPARARFVERIAALFPGARILAREDLSHMAAARTGRLPIAERVRRGTRTLVLGAMGRLEKPSRERGIVCPGYRSLSLTASCWYRCAYCYLAGTIASTVSPAIKIFVNVEDALASIERRIRRARDGIASWYIGKLQDALSLDPLTAYSRILIPFFAARERARLVLLTKSPDVENLLDLEHRGRTAVAFSLSPDAVASLYEPGAPPPAARIRAAARIRSAGYPVRWQLMPLIPIPGWRDAYADLIARAFGAARPERITLGGVCSFPAARGLLRAHVPPASPIRLALEGGEVGPDGRLRYRRALRVDLYRELIGIIRDHDPAVPIALCLEEEEVWRAAGLDPGRARCTCPA